MNALPRDHQSWCKLLQVKWIINPQYSIRKIEEFYRYLYKCEKIEDIQVMTYIHTALSRSRLLTLDYGRPCHQLPMTLSTTNSCSYPPSYKDLSAGQADQTLICILQSLITSGQYFIRCMSDVLQSHESNIHASTFKYCTIISPNPRI